MHREFRKLLTDAEGISKFIIALNIDVRGFSDFSKQVDSQDVASYIKRVYMKLLDTYFQDISFAKATGDGLLIALSYTERNLSQVATKTMESCLEALRDFGSFCNDDPMVNFEVPRQLGIGMSRGSACCLISGRKVLDYSGSVLNLASRLMDFARPSGIVLDANFQATLFPKNIQQLLAEDEVYIKGIHEDSPLKILYTRDCVKIPEEAKKPLHGTEWHTEKRELTLKEIKGLEGPLVLKLARKPQSRKRIAFKITCPHVAMVKKGFNYSHFYMFTNFKYREDAGRPVINVDMDALKDLLSEQGLNLSSVIKIEISYPVH